MSRKPLPRTHVYNVIVNRVIDGDTVDVNVDLGSKIFTHVRVRLDGIDTPEIHTRDEKEKELGLAAKEALSEILFEAEDEHGMGSIILYSDHWDKYGTVLGRLEVPLQDTGVREDVAKKMIELGYARDYAGGKWEKWT